jgi:hypothetical protein
MNTKNDDPTQPQRSELHEQIAELRNQIRLCPGLTDEMLADLFGFTTEVVERQRLRVEKRRLTIHDEI